MNCPKCSSTELVKNGIRSSGKQNFKCKIALVDKLFLERISLVGIARVVEVSER